LRAFDEEFGAARRWELAVHMRRSMAGLEHGPRIAPMRPEYLTHDRLSSESNPPNGCEPLPRNHKQGFVKPTLFERPDSYARACLEHPQVSKSLRRAAELNRASLKGAVKAG